jgi:hypothetical protein
MFLNPALLTLYAQAQMAESERCATRRALIASERSVSPAPPERFHSFPRMGWFLRHKAGAVARL